MNLANLLLELELRSKRIYYLSMSITSDVVTLLMMLYAGIGVDDAVEKIRSRIDEIRQEMSKIDKLLDRLENYITPDTIEEMKKLARPSYGSE